MRGEKREELFLLIFSLPVSFRGPAGAPNVADVAPAPAAFIDLRRPAGPPPRRFHSYSIITFS